MAKSTKHLGDSYEHKTSKTGRLTFMEDWVETHLGAGPEETVKHFRIPGLQAVILVKPNDFHGLDERIINILKDEDQLQEDFEAVRAQIIADHEAKKAAAAEEE